MNNWETVLIIDISVNLIINFPKNRWFT